MTSRLDSYEASVLSLDTNEVKFLLDCLYGLQTKSVTPLSGEAASTCRVSTPLGKMVFKAVAVSSGNERDIVNWQGDVIESLSRQGLPVPRLVADLNGQHTVDVRFQGRGIVIQLFEWLEGEPVAAVAVDKLLLSELGLTAARLQLALLVAPTPPTPITHAWDIRRAGDSIASSLEAIDDPRTRAVCSRARDFFEAVVGPEIATLPSALVHHDLNDFNVLTQVDPDGARRVSGVLDFGDMLEGPRVAELAVVAAYAIRSSDQPLEALLHVCAGWNKLIELDDTEVRVLLPLVTARLAVNSAVWAARLGSTRSAYADSRMRGSLITIERLLDIDVDDVEKRVRSLVKSNRAKMESA